MSRAAVKSVDATSWTNIRPEDRLLPVQPVLKELYNEDADQYFSRLLQLCTFSGEGFSLLDRYDIELPKGFSYYQLGSDAVTLRLLRFLIQICGCKNVLEVGTFVGGSAMLLAEVMPATGKVVTLEKFGDFAEVARRNIQQNDYADRIEVLQGDALELLDTLQDRAPFDFIFLDGDKGNYDKLLPRLMPLSNGLIVVDDVLFHGDVLNDTPVSVKGQGVHNMLDYVEKSNDFVKALLPIGNGVLLLKKLS